MDARKLGAQLFADGFNCAQAVFGAFCEKYGLALPNALRLAGGLGSGLRAAEVCGAASGAVLVIGLKYGTGDKDDNAAQSMCNRETERFLSQFGESNGAIVCRALLGCDITTPHGRRYAVDQNLFETKCAALVQSAIGILIENGY